MNRIILLLVIIGVSTMPLLAQPPASKEQQELEKQRQQIKKELEQAQALLDKNKKTTRENMSTLIILNNKLNKQASMVQNISKEINLMDNNIYKSQRDVNKLQLLLDTLKQEYAKSMVYAYKNRSNADFLNFIFSATSFNDAIKRISYLKSYRNYRELQGDNILRTQALLKSRIDELSGNKQKKSVVLQVQTKEVNALQVQQEEKNQMVARLKAQGKELANQVAAKKSQMNTVNKAITAAIKRAIKEANDAAIAKAKEERRKRESLTAPKTTAGTETAAKTAKVKKEPTAAPSRTSVLLATEADVKLNSSFQSNKNNLPWPVSSGYILLHYGANDIDRIEIVCSGISIGCDIGTPVKVIFDGEVQLVNNYDGLQMVVVKHGSYFTTYSNITGVNLSKGQEVKVGQVIGRAAANLDGVGAVDLNISRENTDLDPQAWLKRR